MRKLAGWVGVWGLVVTASTGASSAAVREPRAKAKVLILAQDDRLELKVGIGEAITVTPARIVKVSSPRAGELRILARKPGSVRLNSSRQNWIVHVLGPREFNLRARFLKQVPDLKGLTLDVESGRLIVRGELWRWSDWAALNAIHKETQGAFQWRASVPEDLRDKAASVITANRALPNGTQLSWDPYPRLLAPKNSVSAAEQQGASWGLEVQAALASAPKPLLRLDVNLSELTEARAESLGVDFNQGQVVQILPKFNPNVSLEGTLSHQGQSGENRVLARPSLLVRSGEEVDYLVGGEFPVRVSNYRQRDVQWRRYGVILKLRAEIVDQNAIRITGTTEISTPDYANQMDGLPSLRTQRLNTSVDLPAGETALLAQFEREDFGRAAQGAPYLMDLPVLGRLFQSRNFQNRKSKLMIILTPQKINLEPPDESRSNTLFD